MSNVQDQSRSNSGSSSSDQNRSVDKSSSWSAGIEHNPKLLVQTANKKKNLFSVLKQYGINVQRPTQYVEWSASIVCPFPFHKGGRERSPSFAYNFNKDSFHCFGCGMSGGSVEFVAFKESLDKLIVAEQFIQELGGYDTIDEVLDNQNQEIEQLLFGLAIYLQTVISKNKDNASIINLVDKYIWWIDMYLLSKAPTNKLTVKDIEWISSKIRWQLEEYK